MKMRKSTKSATASAKCRNGKAESRINLSRKYIYIICVYGLSTALTLIASLASPLFLFAFLPIFKAAKSIFGYILLQAKEANVIPKTQNTPIPDNACVLVIVPCILRGEEEDCTVFEGLENMYLANSEQNIIFGILADIRDSSTAKAHGDDDTIRYARGRIGALCAKHGNHFILFLRRRSYSKSEEAFMGRDGKAGALCDLVRFITCDDEATFSEASVQSAREITGNRKIRYIVLPGKNTTAVPGVIKSMYLRMIHPKNAPHTDAETGIVTEGYGIMQPKIRYRGAYLLPDEIYVDSDSVSQHLFSKCIFRGIGIIDADIFHRVINSGHPLPEDRILNGDIPIGAMLGCGYIREIEFTQECRENIFSCLSRIHESVRADIQNLIYAFFCCPERNGLGGFFSRLCIFESTSDGIVPIFSFICIFSAMLSQGITSHLLVFFALFYMALPVILRLSEIISANDVPRLFRRFFSQGTKIGIYGAISRTLTLTAMLPMNALYSADAALKSVYRTLFTKKRLLRDERRCIAVHEKKGLLDFVHSNIFSAFSGFLLFAFSGTAVLKIISVLWFAFPVIAYHTGGAKSRTLSEEACITDTRDSLKKASVDEIRSLYSKSIAECASLPFPSGVGFYMLSLLCARDFGLIDTSELYGRMRCILSFLKRTESFRGHFYTDCRIASSKSRTLRCISAKESAILTACLITLQSGLSEYVNEEIRLLDIIKGLSAIENGMDYSILYDVKCSLYYDYMELSHDGTCTLSEHHLDGFMSTARLLGYIQCAKRKVPVKHWESLRREYISRSCHIGISEKNGDEADYILPEIFLPLYNNTLAYEAVHFALGDRHAIRNPSIRFFALCTSSFDGILQKRFMSSGTMRCAESLLLEDIPTDIVIKRKESVK